MMPHIHLNLSLLLDEELKYSGIILKQRTIRVRQTGVVFKVKRGWEISCFFRNSGDAGCLR